MTNQELLEKFARNTASEEEIAIFWERLKDLPPQEVTLLIDQYETLLSDESDYGQVDEALLLEMQQRVANWEGAKEVSLLRRYWAAAVVVLLLMVTGAYLWFPNSREQAVTSVFREIPTDIEPGREGAILILADGTQVVLDSLGNGLIATQNGTRVVLQDGQLAYDPTGKAAESIVYNTMSTPKGRQFNLRLPDGTRVWLNSASSLRYPTAFSGKERRVEITGEAYFEVVRNTKQPFRVSVAGQMEVEVLGTSFNVDAYENEERINTTLLEGSLKVMDGQNTQPGMEAVLKPGQQAQLLIDQKAGQRDGAALSEDATTAKGGIDVVNADINKVMAWKNGAFNFENASLVEVMRQLERWYDIEVVYEKDIPDIHFVGKMSRDVSLAELIKGLEGLEIHFRIEEGRKLVVMP